MSEQQVFIVLMKIFDEIFLSFTNVNSILLMEVHLTTLTGSFSMQKFPTELCNEYFIPKFKILFVNTTKTIKL